MIKVLVIEKLEVTQDIVREILTLTLNDQIDFQFSCDGTQTKKILANYTPDLIIADFSSQGMNDKTLMEKIKSYTKTPVIAIFSNDFSTKQIDYSHDLAREARAVYTLSKDRLIKSLPSITLSALQNISANLSY